MRTALTIAIAKGFAAGALLLCLLVAPALAEGPAIEKPTEKEAAELREWYSKLPPQRQEMLKRRLKAFKQLDPKRQKELIEKLRGSGLAFNDDQSKAVGKLQKLPYLARVRLHLLGDELKMIEKREPEFFAAALKKPANERNRELGQRILMSRIMRYTMTLPEDQRAAFEKLRPAERIQRYMAAKNERINALLEANPRYADLKANADKGDAEARRALGALRRDVSTLDDLVERYAPEIPAERREALREKVREAVAREGLERGNPAFRQFGKALKDSRTPRKPDGKEFDRRPAMAPDRGRSREERK
ncbi:MAG: hypothetical protein IT461_02410 [Planctomycetes bacterium]|nr:hypothetical protein [Planctomycetota bacterium]